MYIYAYDKGLKCFIIYYDFSTQCLSIKDSLNPLIFQCTEDEFYIHFNN